MIAVLSARLSFSRKAGSENWISRPSTFSTNCVFSSHLRWLLASPHQCLISPHPTSSHLLGPQILFSGSSQICFVYSGLPPAKFVCSLQSLPLLFQSSGYCFHSTTGLMDVCHPLITSLKRIPPIVCQNQTIHAHTHVLIPCQTLCCNITPNIQEDSSLQIVD